MDEHAIVDVVREAGCGVILPEYSAAEIGKAFAIVEDRNARNAMAANAGRHGKTYLNWEKGEEILYREYSVFLRGALRGPSSTQTANVPAVGMVE